MCAVSDKRKSVSEGNPIGGSQHRDLSASLAAYPWIGRGLQRSPTLTNKLPQLQPNHSLFYCNAQQLICHCTTTAAIMHWQAPSVLFVSIKYESMENFLRVCGCASVGASNSTTWRKYRNLRGGGARREFSLVFGSGCQIDFPSIRRQRRGKELEGTLQESQVRFRRLIIRTGNGPKISGLYIDTAFK